ncbi:MAG: hypothetical protein E7337_12115 [Clostridiales bacterium]|nr:hypothetical protein [Clostridiales bacterium]
MHNLTVAKKTLSILYRIVFAVVFLSFYFGNTVVSSTFLSPILDACLLWSDMFVIPIMLASVAIHFYESWMCPTDRGRLIVGLLVKLGIVLAFVWINALTKTARFHLLIMLAIGSELQEENHLFKIAFWMGTVLTAVLFALSLMGFVDNLRGNSFGFIYGDDFACFVLCLTMYYCILQDGFLTWPEEFAIIFLPLFMLLNDARTAAISQTLVIWGTFYRHFRRNGGVPFQDENRYGRFIPVVFRLVYLPVILTAWVIDRTRLQRFKPVALRLMRYSFIIAALLILMATLTYRPLESLWARFSFLGSLSSRLRLGLIGIQEYGVNLLGHIMPSLGNGGTELSNSFYFFIDSSYIKILLENGIIIFIIMIGLMTWTQTRLQQNHRNYSSYLVAVFAMDVIMEFELTSFICNLFLVLAFCKLSEKPGLERCDGLGLKKLSPARRWGIGAGVAALGLALVLWCTTAYQITRWRGYTPNYAATVVVPGAYVDEVGSDSLREPRLTRAMRYLASHKDARCIVDDAGDRDWLVARDVAADRIAVAKADSVDEMLLNASAIVSENGYPPRLTVCTYAIQQARIQRRASALCIPVNSLTMKMPVGRHLANFAAEQWRMLWSS